MSVDGIFKALSDPTRVRILKILCLTDLPLPGGEIAKILDEHHYNISRHLKILRKEGFVKVVEQERYVFCFIKSSDILHHVMSIIATKEPELTFRDDVSRLSEYLLAPIALMKKDGTIIIDYIVRGRRA